ncbi:MAG: leucyl/phenylalanyl-tRNA--protein transferase [Byssovorax sp.]
MIFRLDHRLIFPPAELAEDSGVLAVGGDVSEERLILAYESGIFPWPHEGLPLLWHSPDPRTVLVPRDIHVGRSLEKSIRRGLYEVRLDTAFRQVIRGCSQKDRPNQDGTWITDEMIEGYVALHRRGLAHSIESWRGDELVGGLYGISLGGAFFGESMFAEAPDASKVAFATLVRQLDRWGFDFVDCQVHTEHLERFGAIEWSRKRFLAALKQALKKPTRVGPWKLDP